MEITSKPGDEEFFNPGTRCVLKGHEHQHCQERYCKSCEVFQDSGHPAWVPRINYPANEPFILEAERLTQQLAQRLAEVSKARRWKEVVELSQKVTQNARNIKLAMRATYPVSFTILS